MKLYLLTTLAMLAFAANSILCRMALGTGVIDAASFTSIRLISGALMLVALLWRRDASLNKARHVDPVAMSTLFLYAICFSFAYLLLNTGTGALILFGTVQLVLILFGLVSGERPRLLAWVGMALATGGLIYLVSPGVTAPPWSGALLMAGAGLAWGVYTIRGKGSTDPVAATTWNFIGTVPLTLFASIIFAANVHVTAHGVVLAMLSGALASAIGYVIWYAALPLLKSTGAATVQLSVPMIAAFGGVMLMGEPVTLRLLLASVAILGGIGLVIATRRRLHMSRK